ncbi:MAG: hypothetical protein KGJ13_01735 [Patescibacteria group bacterium]|nr:hypothetical protein [Patescibacteria group bacterium]
MKKALCLGFAFGVLAFGQAPVMQTTQETPDVVQRLERLQQEVKQARRDINRTKSAAEKAAKGQEDAAIAAEKQRKGIQDSITAVGDAEKFSARKNEERGTLLWKELQKTSRMVVWSLILVGLLLIGGAFFLFWKFPSRNKSAAQKIIVVERARLQGFDPNERLIDPKKEDLQNWAARAKSAGCKFDRIPMRLVFEEGRNLDCEAELRAAQDPLVHVGGRMRPITWTKRYSDGADFIGIPKKSQKAANSITV